MCNGWNNTYTRPGIRRISAHDLECLESGIYICTYVYIACIYTSPPTETNGTNAHV